MRSNDSSLVILGDDIGIWNLPCCSRGMMGYHRTHNQPEGLGQAGR
jgi:hypothetical protein